MEEIVRKNIFSEGSPEQKSYENGLKILTDGKVRRIGDDLYPVHSQDGDGEYLVERYRCPCPAALFGPTTSCKHVWAVIIFNCRNPEDFGITTASSCPLDDLPGPRKQPSAATALVQGCRKIELPGSVGIYSPGKPDISFGILKE